MAPSVRISSSFRRHLDISRPAGEYSRGVTLSKTVQDFFECNDAFLAAQFSHALGEAGSDLVEAAHLNFTSHAGSISFHDPQFEKARLQWLAILRGMGVNLGFTALRKITYNKSDIAEKLEEKLETARSEIDATHFLPKLCEYSDAAFDENGLGLDVAPDQWLSENDWHLPTSVEPEKFKDQLFALTGFSNPLHRYHFKKSKSGGFFMMSLHTRPVHCIGHGRTDSLFGLSTLAHEIGHSTTSRQSSLDQIFLEFPASVSDEVLVNDEDDSYRYERIFMENVNSFVPQILHGNDADLLARLAQRKAIQNNLHVLKNRMNFDFFSGMALRQLSVRFRERIKQIYPSYAASSDFDWLKYSTLDQPLSRIGYLKAYPVFLSKR